MADERIGRYELRALLGQGGFGRVHLAYDRDLGREVALKIVRPELADEEKIREWFHREARAIAALNHPGMVRVFDYSGSGAAELFLAMERLHGHTLADVLDARGNFPALALCSVAAQLGQALAHAHSRGIVHRDLKPENIFIEPDGRVVVTDFGLARALPSFDLGHSLASRGTQLVGTAHYLSPEVISDPAAAGPQSDIYAVGLVLYELASGRQAFASDSAFDMISKIMSGKHKPLGQWRTDYPAPVAAAIERAFAFGASARPQNGDELAALFTNAARPLGDDPTAALRQFLHAPDDAFTRVAKAKGKVATTQDAVPPAGPPLPTTERMPLPDTRPAFVVGDETRLVNVAAPAKKRRLTLVVAAVCVAGAAALVLVFRPPRESAAPQIIAASLPSENVVLAPAAQQNPPPAPSAVPVPPPAAALPAQPATAVTPVAPTPHPPPSHARAPHPPPVERAAAIEAPGALEVNTGKNWAEIYVDKKKLGDTPMHPLIALSPGRYVVRIVNPELGAVERKVTIMSGKTTPLLVEFAAP